MSKKELRPIIDPIQCDCGTTIKHGKTNPEHIVICPKCGQEWVISV